MVVIVDDATPPTVFTLGKSAVPVKSPANCMIPLFSKSASVAFIIYVAMPDPIGPNYPSLIEIP